MSEITGNFGVHNASKDVHWIGGNGSWSDASNWEGDAIPNLNSCQQASINNRDACGEPTRVVVDSSVAAQIMSLSVGPNSSLAIIARNPVGKDLGSVFSTQGFELYGGSSIVIDTPDRVDLGGVSNIGKTSSLTIENNNGNVILDGQRLSGNGTLNLVNSTLGTVGSPVSIDNSMTVTLQGGSTLYAGIRAAGGTVVFDTNTVNTLVVNNVDENLTTKLVGVSNNTRIEVASGYYSVKSTKMVDNGNGSSTLTIQLSNGKDIVFSDVELAPGFDASGIRLVKDSDGGTSLVFTGHGATQDNSTFTNVIAQADNAVGTATPTYNYPTMQHNHSSSDYWTGAAGDNNWYNTANWSQGKVPQQTPSSEAVINQRGCGQTVVNVNTPSYSQITSMGIGSNVTLNISTTGPDGEAVFSTQGFEMFANSQININTNSKVELGGVLMMRSSTSELNINGNHGNVILDNANISGIGQINLNNSWIGSDTNPISIGDNTVTLTNDSQFFTSFRGVGAGKIIVDPTTTNTIYFPADEGYSDAPYGVTIEGVSSKTVFGIEPTGSHTPTGATWSKNDNGTYTLTVSETGGNKLELNNISFAPGQTPRDSTVVPQADGSWLIEPNNPLIVYVWNGPDQGGDPNNPANWLVNGKQAVEAPRGADTEVFNNGHDVQLKTDTPFAFGTVLVTDKTNVSLTSGGTTIDRTIIDPRSGLYVTAPSGKVSIGEVHNRGEIISCAPLETGRITNYYNGSITAQNGLFVDVPYDTNAGRIEVWGAYVSNGREFNNTTEAMRDPDYKKGHNPKVDYDGSLIVHGSNYTCFAEDTRFVTVDASIVKVQNLQLSDNIAGAGQVTWVGRAWVEAGSTMIRLGNLTVTPDHLILVDGILVPAQEVKGAEALVSTGQWVYHFQTSNGHSVVNANGTWADTLMYDPSRPEMETVCGTLDRTRARWGINTAAPLRSLELAA